MKKILIADDHNIVRTGLIFLLRTEFMQVEIDECRDGRSTLEKVQAKVYDLLILDIGMPYTDPFSLLKEIFDHRPEQKILVLTVNSEDVYAKKYLRLGAKGFINKEASASEIRQAIVSILNNKRYMSSRVRETLMLETLEAEAQSLFDGLSAREFEIMNHLADGKVVSEIARLLSLHISTVSTHKAALMKKLGVSNVIELNRLVQKN
jgi:DNA-binding NarL/FixJ family response regulator